MLNNVVLIGRLVRDPELRYTPQGVARCNFTLAVDRPHAKDGRQQADFVDIVAWRRLAETVAEYTCKGSLVAVQGRLQIRSYEHDGQRRRAAEVVASEVRFLDYRKREEDDSGFDPFGEGESVSWRTARAAESPATTSGRRPSRQAWPPSPRPRGGR